MNVDSDESIDCSRDASFLKNALSREDVKDAIRKSISSFKKPDEDLDEIFSLIQLINNILSSNLTLTKRQQAEYCASQRHFMKLYVKKLMAKSD